MSALSLAMLTPTRDRGRCRRRGRPARGSESAKQENIFIQKSNIYLLMIQKSEQKIVFNGLSVHIIENTLNFCFDIVLI